MAQEQQFISGDWVTAIRGYRCRDWFEEGDTFQLVEIRTFMFSMKGMRGSVKGHLGGFNWSENYIRKATQEEILKVTSKMEKKIIGYNLKNLAYEKAYKDLIPESGTMGRTIGGKADVRNPNNIEALKKAGVLELWFEPVYEEDSITISIGTPRVDIVIGKGEVRAKDYQFSRTDIVELLAFFRTKKTIGGFYVYPTSMQFGCLSEGIIFSEEDIDKLTKEWKKLNP